MDLREKKTIRSIKNAFLQLRSHKPLERITIKELSELAEISKATFYLHYKDIYDLSNQLQQEVIQDILNCIIQPNVILFDMAETSKLLFQAFCSHQSMIDILFSGMQATILPANMEQSIKEYAFRINPTLRNDAKFNVIVSYHIYGAYYAHIENHRKFGTEQVIDLLDNFIEQNPISVFPPNNLFKE